MTCVDLAERRASVTDVLMARTRDVCEPRPGRWQAALVNGAVLKLDVRLEDDWLCASASLPGGDGRVAQSPEALWDLLELNAGLPGGARVALSPDGRARALAEFPVAPGLSVGDRLCQVFEGFESAAAQCGAGNGARRRRSADAKRGPADVAALEDLRGACMELGWPATVRASGRLAITLAADRAFCQGIVELPEPAGLRVRAEVVRGDGEEAVSQHAVGLLLLSAGALVRQARPVGQRDDTGVCAWFEVVLPASPTLLELDCALGALSVACRLLWAEAKEIQRSPTIARQYLAARGGS